MSDFIHFNTIVVFKATLCVDWKLISPLFRHTARSPPFIHVHTKTKPAGRMEPFLCKPQSCLTVLMMNLCLYMWGFIAYKCVLAWLALVTNEYYFRRLTHKVTWKTLYEFTHNLSSHFILETKKHMEAYRNVILSPDFWANLLRTEKKTLRKHLNEMKVWQFRNTSKTNHTKVYDNKKMPSIKTCIWDILLFFLAWFLFDIDLYFQALFFNLW